MVDFAAVNIAHLYLEFLTYSFLLGIQRKALILANFMISAIRHYESIILMLDFIALLESGAFISNCVFTKYDFLGIYSLKLHEFESKSFVILLVLLIIQSKCFQFELFKKIINCVKVFLLIFTFFLAFSFQET